MTPEQLMQPRVIVIADYPKSIYEIGTVVRIGGHNGDCIYCDTTGPKYTDYPHLFRKLQWWEHRKPEDMPEYVKLDEHVYKIKDWDNYRAPYVFIIDDVHIGWRKGCEYAPLYGQHQPATFEEYNAYLTQKRKEMTPEGKAAELVVKARELLVRLLPPSEYEENEDCAHLYDIIGELGHRTDNAGLYASIQSPTPEAVAVAFGEWIKKKNRDTSILIGWFDYYYRQMKYTSQELFTLFAQSDEYKELTK